MLDITYDDLKTKYADFILCKWKELKTTIVVCTMN